MKRLILVLFLLLSCGEERGSEERCWIGEIDDMFIDCNDMLETERQKTYVCSECIVLITCTKEPKIDLFCWDEEGH
jgi:hypothetical protein